MSALPRGAASAAGAAAPKGPGAPKRKLDAADFDDDELLRGDFDDLAFLNQGVEDIDADTTLSEGEKAARREERLERNREIARNCRKRKRERIELLMEEVAALRENNRVLELKLKMAQNKLGEATSGRGNRGKEEESRRLKEVRTMNKMLDQKYADEEVVKRLRAYSETYADFGEERIKLVKVHTAQLEQLLLPTQVSKMLLWILQQDDDFYSGSDPSSIWNMLCNELKLDEQQKASIKEQRGQLGLQNASMKKGLIQLNKFESEVAKNMELRRKQIAKVMSLISPTQTIRFLQWVEDNQACIHMLNGLWSVNKQRNKDIIDEIMPDPDDPKLAASNSSGSLKLDDS